MGRRRRDRYTSYTIDDPVVTGERRLPRKLSLTQLRAVDLDLFVKHVDELRLGVRARVRYLVVRQYAYEVRDGECRGVEVGLEVVPFLDDLARRWARHPRGRCALCE